MLMTAKSSDSGQQVQNEAEAQLRMWSMGMYLNPPTKSSRLTCLIAGLFGAGTTGGSRQTGSEYTNSRTRNLLPAAQVHGELYRWTVFPGGAAPTSSTMVDGTSGDGVGVH